MWGLSGTVGLHLVVDRRPVRALCDVCRRYTGMHPDSYTARLRNVCTESGRTTTVHAIYCVLHMAPNQRQCLTSFPDGPKKSQASLWP